MKIRCKCCNTELEAVKEYRGQSCHCPNETYIRLDKHGQPIIMAKDLSQVQIVESLLIKNKEVDKQESINYNKRKPRKLNYEVR
jgi:hypothetical protein